MARGVNKVILIGNLAEDPKVNSTASGTAVCNFRIITNESYKDSSGEWVERAEGHNIVAWGRLAEICGNYLNKGKQVYIEGSLQSRSYEGKDGNMRYITEIKAKELQMLGSRSDSGGSGGQYSGQSNRNYAKNTPQKPVVAEDPVDLDDDLPF